MNREEFIKCVEHSQASLRRFLVSVCAGNVAMAEDIAQEAYLKAFLASENFENSGNFNAWIIKIAFNTFLNWIRQNCQNARIEEIQNYESCQRADESFRFENVYQALQHLSAGERSAIILYYLEGYSTKEIAGILDMSDMAVRQALSRGRKNLKTMIN